MAHNFETGFVVREPAWHGLANVLDDYPGDWNTARRLAGLDWEPVEAPIFAAPMETPETIFAEVPAAPEPLDGFKVVRRSDTGKVLHVHRDSYEVFPNADLGPLVEAFLAQGEDVKYETAGVLDGGKKVWVMVKLAEPFMVPGDPSGATLSRIAIQNSHDCSGALRAQRLQTRIVCDNTSLAADREAGRHGLEFMFRHTQRIHEYVEQAKQALAGLHADRANYLEWAADLLDIRISEPQAEAFIQAFIPQPVGEVVSDRVRGNVEDAQGRLRSILSSPTTEQVKHTAYGLVAASIEYLDHSRAFRSAETHFTREVALLS
jgi:phage/plasmid-like protein (TIGR03299 family)